MKTIISIILCLAIAMSFCCTAFAEAKIKYDGNKYESMEKKNTVTLKKITASSELTSEGTTYYAGNAVDGDPKTCWQEGASGYGIGEYLKLTFACSNVAVTGLSFVIGYARNADTYNANGKPKVLDLEFSDGSLFTVELDNESTEQEVDLPVSVTADWVKIEIAETYSGLYFKDTAISEIAVYGE